MSILVKSADSDMLCDKIRLIFSHLDIKSQPTDSKAMYSRLPLIAVAKL